MSVAFTSALHRIEPAHVLHHRFGLLDRRCGRRRFGDPTYRLTPSDRFRRLIHSDGHPFHRACLRRRSWISLLYTSPSPRD